MLQDAGGCVTVGSVYFGWFLSLKWLYNMKFCRPGVRQKELMFDRPLCFDVLWAARDPIYIMLIKQALVRAVDI